MSEQNKIDEIKAIHAASTPEWYDYLKHDAYEYITYLLQEIERKDEALRFYADEENWTMDKIDEDRCGYRARNALGSSSVCSSKGDLVEENSRLREALMKITKLKAHNQTDLYWRGQDAIEIAREAL